MNDGDGGRDALTCCQENVYISGALILKLPLFFVSGVLVKKP